MSRIDDALRRAERAPGVRGDEPFGSSERAASEPGALERYVPEDSPAQERSSRERLAHAPQRPEPVLGGATVAALRPRIDVPVEVAPRRGPADAGGKLVVDADASPVSVEQYRRLAATLYQAQMEGGLKSIMVSSALPREGKTLTATNLALTLSESYGQRVVIIDGDLRAPAVHTAFGFANAHGVTEYLRGTQARLPIIEVSPTLSVITAGDMKGNPIAGLVSDRMAALLKEAAARFDWVIVDTPPVGLLPDANLLARLTDAVIFVVAAGSTPHAIVQRAVTAIGNERIIGVVLNRAADSAMPHSTYYSHYSAAAGPAETVR